MMKKKIIFGITFIIIMIVWIFLNPPDRFGKLCFFGFTTYNIVPVPYFDIQVRENSSFKLVKKTHNIDMQEIKWLLNGNTDILIIANGWNGIAKSR